MKEKKIVIIGAGMQGRLSKDLAIENGYRVVAFVDDYVKDEVEGIKVVNRIEDVENYQDCNYFIAFGKINPRKKYRKKLKELNLKTVNLIDKSAHIGEGAEIGTGNYIYKNAIIYSTAKIGDDNIINCKAVLATDCVIGNNNNVSMGCNLCGGVVIGDNNYIGCQASLVSGVTMGSDSVIGACSAVLDDIESGVLVAGAPAVKKADR